MNYYKSVKKWLEDLSPGNIIIDVGSRDSHVALWGDFKRRIMIDVNDIESIDGAEFICTDWIDYPCPYHADVITCLQVLEHLHDDVVIPFTQKLLENSRWAILSVPYKWDPGTNIRHKQDPVDLEKLVNWTKRPPLQHEIVADKKRERLVALFEGDNKNT